MLLKPFGLEAFSTLGISPSFKDVPTRRHLKYEAMPGGQAIDGLWFPVRTCSTAKAWPMTDLTASVALGAGCGSL